MDSIREWDSLSQIDLMLALDESFGLKSLSADDFVKLNSYENILKVVVALGEKRDR
jgi:acyl carrier protein